MYVPSFCVGIKHYAVIVTGSKALECDHESGKSDGLTARHGCHKRALLIYQNIDATSNQNCGHTPTQGTAAIGVEKEDGMLAYYGVCLIYIFYLSKHQVFQNFWHDSATRSATTWT